MAIRHTISLFRGEDVTLPFNIDEDVTGWLMTLYVNDTMADSTPALSVEASITDAATGLVEVALTSAQTATLTLPVYNWELDRTNSGAVAVLAYGTLSVLPRVPA